MTDPKERFSDRVGDYKKYRPSYPPEIVTKLISFCNLTSDSVVADIGAGTGIFTRLLLDNGFETFAVEPNASMRSQAEIDLQTNDKFISVNGTAEDSTLGNSSIDLVTVCQAFHWFDRTKCKIEFQRILKSTGFVALIRNERSSDTPFLKGYEELLLTLPEYAKSNHRNITEDEIADFYNPNKYTLLNFSNSQSFDFEGVRGRLLSSSYSPKESDEQYGEITSNLEALFDKYNNGGKIDFNYKTTLYVGPIDNK